MVVISIRVRQQFHANDYIVMFTIVIVNLDMSILKYPVLRPVDSDFEKRVLCTT